MLSMLLLLFSFFSMQVLPSASISMSKPLEIAVTQVEGHFLAMSRGSIEKTPASADFVGISGKAQAFVVPQKGQAIPISLTNVVSGAVRAFAVRNEKSIAWTIDKVANQVYSKLPDGPWKPFESKILATEVVVGFGGFVWAIGAAPFCLYYRLESSKDDWRAVNMTDLIGAVAVSSVDASAYVVTADGFLAKVNEKKNGYEKILERLPDKALFQGVAVAHSEMILALSAEGNVYRKYTGKKGDKQEDWALLSFSTTSEDKKVHPITKIQQIIITPENVLFIRAGVPVVEEGITAGWPVYSALLSDIVLPPDLVSAQNIPAMAQLSEGLLSVSLAADSAWEADQHALAGPNGLGELCLTIGKVGARWTKNRNPQIQWFSLVRKDGPECAIGVDGKVYRRNNSLKKDWEADKTAPANPTFSVMGYAGDVYIIANRKAYFKKLFATADEGTKGWEQVGEMSVVSVGMAQVDNDGTVLAVGLDGKLYRLNAAGKGFELVLEKLPGGVSFRHIIVVDKDTFFAVGENKQLYRNYSGAPATQEKYWTEVVCMAAKGARITGIQHAAISPRGGIVLVAEPKHTVTAGFDWTTYFGKVALKFELPATVTVPAAERAQKNKYDVDASSRSRGLQAFASITNKKNVLSSKKKRAKKQKALIS